MREFLPESIDNLSIIGTDEVGRGPLAGPVVCSSVQFCGDWSSLDALLALAKELKITDSKKISAKKRAKILNHLGIDVASIIPNVIYSHNLFNFSLSSLDPSFIEEVNILQATLEGMRLSATAFFTENYLWLVDGNQQPICKDNVIPIVKGDQKCILISIASIIAKEYRDHLMGIFDSQYPGYDFKSNSGYGTKKHLEALKSLGPTLIHRPSFIKNIIKQ